MKGGVPGGVTRASNYLIVVDEPAARQVPGVAGQFAADAHVPLAGLQRVDRAHIIQPATGHEISARGVSTGHHPRGTQRYCMNL